MGVYDYAYNGDTLQGVSMAIHLPQLSGANLASMRDAFDLSQADLAIDTGCSVSAIQKAEAGGAVPVGPTLARALAPHLLGARDVMLELALTLPAVERASKLGVKRWRTPVGDCWWLPQLRAWRQSLALETHRTFASIDSMARFLCTRIGISEGDGVLLCEACEDAAVQPPNAAWRACAKCGTALCGSEDCGRYVLAGTSAVHDGPPVMCLPCVRQATNRAMRRPAPLPDTSRTQQLESIWTELRAKCSEDDSYHNGFRLIVEDEIEEAESRVAAVRRAMRKWVHRPHHALVEGLAEEEAMREALIVLHRRVVDFRS